MAAKKETECPHKQAFQRMNFLMQLGRPHGARRLMSPPLLTRTRGGGGSASAECRQPRPRALLFGVRENHRGEIRHPHVQPRRARGRAGCAISAAHACLPREPDLKRMLCRKCRGLLEPGVTATVRVKGAAGRVCRSAHSSPPAPRRSQTRAPPRHHVQTVRYPAAPAAAPRLRAPRRRGRRRGSLRGDGPNLTY